MNTNSIKLPYFDFLISRIGSNAKLAAWNDHVHWGLFEDNFTGPVSEAAFADACKALTQRLITMADLKNGLAVLDVGCGFGGTTRMISDAYGASQVTGVNIDARQLEIARQLTRQSNARFIEGDACALPFEDHTFDRVLAVECIFHFPSRLRFLKEVKRVLKPNGCLVFSDFVFHGPKLPSIVRRMARNGNPIELFYGSGRGTTKTGYRILAALSGLKMSEFEDVTQRTLPTYKFLKEFAVLEHQELMLVANNFMEEMMLSTELRYALVAMRA